VLDGLGGDLHVDGEDFGEEGLEEGLLGCGGGLGGWREWEEGSGRDGGGGGFGVGVGVLGGFC
jgi:hypothetical protein